MRGEQQDLFAWLAQRVAEKVKRSDAARRAAETRRENRRRRVAEGVAEFQRRQEQQEHERRAAEEARRQQAASMRPAWSYSTWRSGPAVVAHWYLWPSSADAKALRRPVAEGRRESVHGLETVLERVRADLWARGVDPVLVPGVAGRWYAQERDRLRRESEEWQRQAEAARQRHAQEAEWQRRVDEAARAAADETMRRVYEELGLKPPVGALRLLGLDPAGAVDELAVTRAYRAKARQVHPDMGGNGEAFINLTEARDAAIRWARRQAS